MKRKFRFESLNHKTGLWELKFYTANKNCPCCSRFERVV